MNFPDDATMHGCPPALDAVTRESRKDFDVRIFHRSASYDAFVAQIFGIIEGAWVAVVARGDERGPKSNALAVGKQTHLIAGIATVILINAEPDSFRNFLRLRGWLKGLSFNVDALPESTITFGL